MTVRQRFSLDSNVLVYAIDQRSGDRHRQASEIMQRAAQLDCVLTVQAFGEFFHATTRKKLLEPSRARVFVDNWLDVFAIAAADSEALIDAIDAVDQHKLSFWDAMLWATAKRAGCAAILSEDQQDGLRLGGVEFINPFATDAAARLATLLDA